MTDQPDNPIIDLMLEFQRALEKQDRRALQRLVEAYERVYGKLKVNIDLLMAKIELEQPTKSQLTKMPEYKALMNKIEEEVSDYQVILEDEIEGLTQGAVNYAGRDTSRLLIAISAALGIALTFNRLPTPEAKSFVDFLAEDSPLYQRMDKIAGFAGQRVSEIILESIALGRNPRETARLIRDELGMTLTDALRMARTAQLWAYREATLANYRNNSEIVNGWYWFAALEKDPCMACIAEHGTFHTLDEVLDDHYNGRCAMLPAIRGLPNPVTQSGEDWFNNLPEAKQKELMGPEFWQAWKGGAFELADMPHKVEDDVYGSMTTSRPLWDLLGAEPPLRTE